MLINTSEQTIVIVQKFCNYLAGRNLEQLINLFADEVDWYIPGNQNIAPWLGRRSSKQEVKEFFNLLWKNTEAISAHIDNILADKNFAVVIGEFSTRMLKTNKIVESVFSIHITIENDLIVRYRLQEDSYGVSVALTS